MLTFEVTVWHDNEIGWSGARLANHHAPPSERHSCITEAWMLRKVEALAVDLRRPCYIEVAFKINDRVTIATARGDCHAWRLILANADPIGSADNEVGHE